MKILKRILFIIINPLNIIVFGVSESKEANNYDKNAIWVFFLSLLITSGLLAISYFLI